MVSLPSAAGSFLPPRPLRFKKFSAGLAASAVKNKAATSKWETFVANFKREDRSTLLRKMSGRDFNHYESG
jgi:hypothetical protein